MKCILHIVPDDKFIDDVVRLHKLGDFAYRHVYVHLSDVNIVDYKYIKSESVKNISVEDLFVLLRSNTYDAVLIHGLYSLPIKYIPEIPIQIKVFWISWGYDIYQNPKVCPAIKLSLYKPLTIELIDGRNRFIRFIHNIRSNVVVQLNRSEEYRQYVNAVKRIDFFSGRLPEEYDLMKKLPFFHAKDFFYRYFYPTNDDHDIGNISDKHDILIGNSGNPSNNHLDIFEILKEKQLEDRKIFVPLNYGGTDEYLNCIINRGTNYFKKHFIPIIDFIEYEDYTELLKKCNIAIFYNERQQALGNIKILLKTGCKVFLSETSIMYRYFRNLGVRVFSIQKELNQNEIESNMSRTEIENNISILRKMDTSDACIEWLQKLYALI